MSTDPFEEFEFRPLTEGLGFQKKEKAERPAGKAFSQSLESIPDRKAALPEIELPLARKKPAAPAARQETPAASTTVDEILKSIQTQRNMDFVEKGQATSVYQLSRHDLSAMILDAMLVTSGTLACLILLLMTTQVDLISAVTQSQDVWILAALASLVAGVSWIYLVMSRVFLGFTPGEWVVDQRIGRPEELGSAAYSLRVTARASLSVATGLLVMPLVSLVVGRDLLGSMTGALLLKKIGR